MLKWESQLKTGGFSRSIEQKILFLQTKGCVLHRGETSSAQIKHVQINTHKERALPTSTEPG